jgi:hypothetical protein
VLKKICKDYNIRQGQKKEVYVNNIMARVELVHCNNSPIQQLVQLLKSAWIPSNAPAHQWYRELFNIIDITDRHYKSVDHHHRIENWRVKFAYIILKYATINPWSTFAATRSLTYLEYRTNLATQLFNYATK